MLNPYWKKENLTPTLQNILIKIDEKSIENLHTINMTKNLLEQIEMT